MSPRDLVSPTWFYDVFRSNNGDIPDDSTMRRGLRRIERQPASPDGAGLNAKGLPENRKIILCYRNIGRAGVSLEFHVAGITTVVGGTL